MLSNIFSDYKILNCESIPEEKELIETIVWIVLSWSLLRTTTESLKCIVMKLIMILMMTMLTNEDLAIL